MKREIEVGSTVIDWVDKTLEIMDREGNKYVVPLDKTIHVTMVGYPEREEKDMQARELGTYMSQGYIIERISFEERADA